MAGNRREEEEEEEKEKEEGGVNCSNFSAHVQCTHNQPPSLFLPFLPIFPPSSSSSASHSQPLRYLEEGETAVCVSFGKGWKGVCGFLSFIRWS